MGNILLNVNARRDCNARNTKRTSRDGNPLDRRLTIVINKMYATLETGRISLFGALGLFVLLTWHAFQIATFCQWEVYDAAERLGEHNGKAQRITQFSTSTYIMIYQILTVYAWRQRFGQYGGWEIFWKMWTLGVISTNETHSDLLGHKIRWSYALG